MSSEKGSEKPSKPAVPKIDPKNLQKAFGSFTKGGFPQQFVAGTTAGWISGYCAGRLGRTVALVAGASLLGFTLAQHQGLVKEAQVKGWTEHAKSQYQQRAPTLISKVKVFANKNRVFALGFTGGFLLGMAY